MSAPAPLNPSSIATTPPAEICSVPSAGSRRANPASSSAPHTSRAFTGSKKIGSQPSARRAVSVTDLPITDAQKIGMSARTGWLISFSGLASPLPWSAGSGTVTTLPS